MLVATIGLAIALQSPVDSEIMFSGLGNHSRKVTTASAKAQAYFNQGLNFVYAFNHGESGRSFRTAIKYDPNCAMAWWGLAIAQGPHINYPAVDPEGAKTAADAIKKAMGLLKNATPAEKALIEATSVRYADPQPEDRSGLDKAFAEKMKEAWARFPKDADIGALYAESLMDLHPWDYWTANGTPRPWTPEITRLIDDVLKVNIRHPQANHLAIHIWEASNAPEKALPAANRLRFMQPGLGHMVHMPSHIDVRLGNWREAIAANERAIKTDEEYRSKRPRQGLYRIYMMHNRHMLAFAAMMVGQSAKSIREVDAMIAQIPEDFKKENALFIDSFVAMPLEARIRFGKWDEILAMPEYPDYLPVSRSLRRAARGVAYAAKGDVDRARDEQMMFEAERAKVQEGTPAGNSSAATILQIAQHMLEGEILLAEEDWSAAIRELSQAVRTEDSLTYDEPPDWILPTRHALGVALLKAERYPEAEQVYRDDLKRHPHNGWALFGLSEALRMRGREADAKRVRGKFEAAWKGADLRISSSCMCLLGK